ncbi:hypothetical protein [Vulcanisaeta souniana]|uniref:Uncharacterized protein n=1 Tax=Vulcanisaeta souniana JCM 11219 TaxID=1293586 RepID=A0A830E987_9CREN|nr:hypothetical protein [Vulcanisaeta souniana]BDR92792.1 hypothetical protein Vsou_18850 [Vulcanisaeta souniana JCM 11219]GGI82095.1 hypothetical protein GCM10007112_18550 [Vulcanisaeta souniana JCM 11219]
MSSAQWMVTVSQILNILMSTGIISIGIATLAIMGLTAVVLYLLGKVHEIWDFIDEAVNYLAIIGGVMLAVMVINKVLVGSLTLDPTIIYKTIYDYSWNAIRYRAWLIWNTCTCPVTYAWCSVRSVQTENATLILESTEDTVPMIYLAQWVPNLSAFFIAIGLGLSVSRLRSIGSVLIAVGLGLYVVVIGGAAVIASQPFFNAMVSDRGIASIINPHSFETTWCANTGLSVHGFGNVLSAYNRLAVYVAQANVIIVVLYALLFVVIYAIRSALS